MNVVLKKARRVFVCVQHQPERQKHQYRLANLTHFPELGLSTASPPACLKYNVREHLLMRNQRNIVVNKKQTAMCITERRVRSSKLFRSPLFLDIFRVKRV